MANYTLKRTVKVSIRPKPAPGDSITSGWKSIDIYPDYTVSQTITDKTYSQKTIQEQHKLHDSSNIVKLNPLNAEFTVPILEENDYDLLYELLLDTENDNLKEFEMLIVPEEGDVSHYCFNCFITSGTFIIERSKNLALKISVEGGYAAVLPHSSNTYRLLSNSIELASRSGTRTFEMPTYIKCVLDGFDLTEALVSMSIELQNKITWTPYQTVESALAIDEDVSTPPTTLPRPTKCTLSKRILSGSITKYAGFDSTLSQNTILSFATNKALEIRAGNTETSGFRFTLTNCSYTTRSNTSDVFTSVYDWKMNDNPTDLSTKILINPS